MTSGTTAPIPCYASPMDTPSKDECWADFWAIMGPALVDLHQQGLLPAEEIAA